jgi:Fe-S cluster biogenesis protein NfuA
MRRRDINDLEFPSEIRHLMVIHRSWRRGQIGPKTTPEDQAMFIQTEATPNPATLKFLPGRTVLETGTLELREPEQAAQSPLAERLFGINGVSGVFFGSDFITVTKAGGGDWQQLKPMILGAIMEHFMSGAPLLNTGSTADGDADEFFDSADAETVATIKDLIETRVRPAVANDGGDITFKGFKDGVVYLNMKGACSGCPSSTATLQHGIQNLLRHYVPDVTEVRPV